MSGRRDPLLVGAGARLAWAFLAVALLWLGFFWVVG